MPFGTEKLMAWLRDGEKNFEDTFIRFDRIHERDRQTYTQTLHDDIGRGCRPTQDDEAGGVHRASWPVADPGRA